MAFQDYKMFAVSIAENILMRRLNKTEEDEKLVEDSLLYKRLVEDYKNSLADFDKFWFPYYEKYNYMLGENNQFSLDFKTNEIYLVPIEV